MYKLARKNLDGSTLKGVRFAALAFISLAMAACDGANQGVQIGNGQNPDPVVIDFPIAYVRAPLPLDDNGDLIQTDVREQITFDFGADLFVKDRASPSSPAINVTGDLMQGMAAIRDVEISYDGTTVIFAMRGPVDLGLDLDDEGQPTWNIWEYNLETAILRRVVPGDVTAEGGHDVAPAYLSDGRIIFASTRQRRSNAILVDEGKPQFQAQDEDVNEAAFVLHIMNADGTNIQQVSFNQSHDLDPTVMSDGKIVFSRWDHAGPNNGVNLYRMNPDGSELELYYGQNSHDTGSNGEIIQFTQPRELEDGRIMSLVRPFSDTNGGGDLITIDTPVYLENTQPTKDNPGMTGPAQARATILDINTAPNEVSPGGRYNSVYPIQDGTGRLLVSWSQCRLTDIVDPAVQPPLDVVFYPCTPENLINPLYEEADPLYGIWIYDPRDETQLPIVPPEEGFMFAEVASADPRPVPPLILDEENRFSLDGDLVVDGEAVISIRSVYDFSGVAIDDIDTLANPTLTTADERVARFLRVVKAVSLPDEDDLELEDEAFGPNRDLGMKEIVGYSMIEPDGSVMMKVPANTALQISVLDVNGRRISQRHHNWLQLRPGQLLECNGCHTAQGNTSHGRFDAFDAAYAGATTPGASFNSGTVDSLFVGDVGETMAEVRARVTCAGSGCSSLEPSMDIRYVDAWTDEVKAGRLRDQSFNYAYIDLTTTPPTTPNCITQAWAANCRSIINYETHIHPLWNANRPVIDPVTMLPVNDPLTGLPLTNNCTNCHNIVNAAGADMVPAGQLDLSDGLDILVPEHFKSYRELLFQSDAQTLDAGGMLIPLTEIVGQDVDGNDIVQTVRVNPSMSAQGAINSNRFFSRFDSAADMHSGFLSDAEKRLIAEWLDVGAQYYNNPFDVPIN